jgi:hypothetical protein
MAKQQQPPPEQELAPFDDCRAALAFALNADQVTAPTAYMNKAMAAVRVEIKKPRKKRKSDAELLATFFPGMETPEQLLEMERDRIRNKRGGSLVRVQALKFRDGMDKHHLAGLILHHFGRLDTMHQVVLTGLVCNAYVPCSCRNLCCRGRRPTERWLKALSDMCSILQLKADVVKVPGKKGLSSQPELRRRIVEDFFTKQGATLTDIMAGIRISYTTAAQHRAWIVEYLETLEEAAWGALMPIFEGAGITGHHL